MVLLNYSSVNENDSFPGQEMHQSVFALHSSKSILHCFYEALHITRTVFLSPERNKFLLHAELCDPSHFYDLLLLRFCFVGIAGHAATFQYPSFQTSRVLS